MTHKQKFFVILAALVVVVGLAGLFDYLYNESDNGALPTAHFQRAMISKEHKAHHVMDSLQEIVLHKDWETLNEFSADLRDDISYYIVNGNNLVFWSDNALDISSLLSVSTIPNDALLKLNSAYCISATVHVDSFRIVSLIKIKDNYDIDDNRYITSDFASGFRMDSRVVLEYSDRPDTYPIYGEKGQYLFSLSKNGHAIFRAEYAYLSAFFYVVGFILFFVLFYLLDYLFGVKMHKMRYLLPAIFVFGSVTSLCLYFNIPDMLCGTDIFSPIYYGSGQYMASLGHLLILSAFLFTLMMIFYYKVTIRIENPKSSQRIIWLTSIQLLSGLFFLIIFWMFNDLLLNSGFELALYRVENISIYSIVAYFVIMGWFVSFAMLRDKCIILIKDSYRWQQLLLYDFLFLLVFAGVFFLLDQLAYCKVLIGFFVLCVTIDMVRYSVKRTIRFGHLVIMVFVYTNFIVWYTFDQIQSIIQVKYAVIADNIVLGDEPNFDVYTHKLLEDVEMALLKDNNVRLYLENQKASSHDRMMRYLNKYYFSDSWENYDLKIFVSDTVSLTGHKYDKQIQKGSLVPYTASFYRNQMNHNSFDYVGILDYQLNNGEVVRLFIALFKKKGVSNYGYQDLLFESESNKLSFALSVAKYVDGNRVYNSGNYLFPEQLNFDRVGLTGEVLYANGYVQYVYPYPDNTYVIVCEEHPSIIWAYVLFLTYLFTIYLFVILAFYIYWYRIHHRKTLSSTLLSQIQEFFLTFAVVSLGVVFAISLAFIYNQYKEIQKSQQMDKSRYITNALEVYFKQNNVENVTASVDLNFFILDLSNLFKTDIHVYNTNGELIATSRPYIFSKGFISKLMNPTVYFQSATKEVVLSEYIGSLKYLTSYTEIKNSDNNTIGYLSVPLFFSSHELSKQLYSFLAIFINIYFFFLLLAALVSVFVSRSLSRPIKTIERKLKAIKLGKRNEKIEYTLTSENDEIATLINQYNLMVDELFESAQLLALSERESAWREMARQIAHEIKNPLTPMKLTIQQLQRTKKMDQQAFDDYFGRATKTLVEQIDNLSFIATEFSNFARIPVAHLIKVDIADKLLSVVELFKHNYEEVDIVYLTTLEQVHILADTDQMTQLFNNLIRNAIQSIPSTQKGRVEVELDRDEEFVIISISDNGCGISDDVSPKLFTPNFTTKSSGMGLGLSIVKNIIAMSQGEITFKTQVNMGTTFYVKFPLMK